METENIQAQKTETFACTNCGAELKYKPGTTQLVCEYCNASMEIPQIQSDIHELDFNEYLRNQDKNETKIELNLIKCEKCGAESTVEPNVKSESCPYCATPFIIANAHKTSVIQPKSLLPFKLSKDDGLKSFKKWINKLWFAPNDLKKAVLTTDVFKGVYLPFWTFDSDTTTQYTGQRGTYYYVNETYTTQENGKTVTKTRSVRRTQWSFCSGTVTHAFDDILVCGNKSLPEKLVTKLEPWDLENLVTFDNKFLSGFVTENHERGLEESFLVAKKTMESEIQNLVCKDIGGDEQRILTSRTNYSKITFKNTLLPVYISAYNFKGKLYRFLINARTGEVQGERPWSAMKIAILVVSIIAAITIIYLIAKK
jgi:hypothetical protein